MQEYDDCYCPHGVEQRQGMKIDTLWMAICAIGLFAVAYMLKVVVEAVVGFVNHVAQETAQFVDRFGFVVLGVIAGVLLCLYLIDRIYYWVRFNRVPGAVKLFLRIRKFIRAYFYRKDLQQRFAERPELSTLTYDEVMGDMTDGHHEGEEPISAEEMEVYWRVFNKLKDEQRTTERTIRYDAGKVPHRKADKA